MPTPPPPAPAAYADALAAVEGWFDAQGWAPFDYQRAAWQAFGRGESGLIHVPTGAGKTYAAFGGPLAWLRAHPRRRAGARIVYLSPLRSVAHDVELALQRIAGALCPDARVESRTGDTSSAVRSRQRRALPEVLITTPESLSLLLARADAPALLAGLDSVIVDEWHALLDSKRGTQTELALAALRRLSPSLRIWALSATLPNVDTAAQAAVGPGRAATLITAPIDRPIHVSCLLPDAVDAFPWAGHLGLEMVHKVVERLDVGSATLVFTNTRNQAERWYQAIQRARPEWGARLAVHHSAIDAEERARIERGLSDGSVTVVVCTTSLDLGVDFGPVERVFNIGSPKGVARLIQRAGRSGHRPGAACEVICVPTHALELIELRAARACVDARDVEPRAPLDAPLDVLAQHMVTRALGGGFTADALFDEVRDTVGYAGLSRAHFDWCLALVREGGATLKAYPQYHKVVADEAGVYGVPDARIARLHRMSIGTIADDPAVWVRMGNGQRLGAIEERFAARLRPGDRFMFAGRRLAFVKLKDVDCVVKPTKAQPTVAARWGGAKMAVSTHLASALLRTFAGEITGGPELAAAAPILAAQAALSRLPRPGTVLGERLQSREGHHLFLYPFEGRNAHEGLAAVLALRLGRRQPATFSTSVNDYGLELMSVDPYPFEAALADPALFDPDALVDDVMAAVNLGELSRRQFRQVARVAGLVFAGYPGKRKTLRQVQASTGLLYDVFRRWDPDNLLLHQAEREVLAQSFDHSRLAASLRALSADGLEVFDTPHPSPLAFPLMVSRINETLFSTEALADRIAAMRADWETP